MTSSDPKPRVVYYRISCTCDHPKLRYNKASHSFQCRNCFATLELVDAGEDQTTDWKETADDMKRQIVLIRERMTAFVIGLARNGMPGVKEPEPQKQVTDGSAYLDTIRKLEKTNDDLKNRLKRAEAEIRDLDSTVDHLRNSDRRRSSVDVHGAMEIILEYMCDVDNVPERKDASEKLRRYLHNLTEKTIMKLEGRGITVTAESPGSSVSGLVEVTDRVSTSDPAMDGKVESNERFGCEFRDDAYPRIANSVRVFRYKDAEASKD